MYFIFYFCHKSSVNLTKIFPKNNKECYQSYFYKMLQHGNSEKNCMSKIQYHLFNKKQFSTTDIGNKLLFL